MRLRQVALVAAELAPARAKFFQLLGLDNDFADDGVAEFGLENSVMAIGDTYLEIVAPTQAGTTAGRLLERRKGDGGYMVLCQVDNIVPFRDHTDALRVRKVWDADLPDVKAFHIHPRDIGAAIVSLDEMLPPESWRWAGPHWQEQQARYVGTIKGVTVQGADAEALAARWGEVFMIEPQNNLLVMSDGSWIEFVSDSDGRGDGVAGVTFAGCDLVNLSNAAHQLGVEWQNNAVDLGGVRLQFSS